MSQVITQEELQSYANPTQLEAGRSELVVAAVNGFIERATGRIWGETASGSEVHDYRGVIFLREMDVVEVTDVKLHGRSLASHSYSYRSTGRLVLSSREGGFQPHYDELEVTYTYGNPVVPDDLKLAALTVALDYYNHVDEDGSQKEVTEEAIGSMRLRYATGSATSVGAAHLAAIQGYRKANV